MSSQQKCPKQMLTILAGVAAIGLGVYKLSQGSSKAATGQETYHIGVETGGTSCKVGILKGIDGKVKKLEVWKKHIVQTTSPAETVKKMCQWLNSQDLVYSSMGVAAFGPLCLDKSSSSYGSVTTTPKVAWQNFPLLKHLLKDIDVSKRTHDFRVDFDTDCNLLAKLELEHGGHGEVKDNLAYITVGTGIGVGFVLNGKGVHGLVHPEGGHVSVPLLPQEEKYNFKGVCQFHGNCVEGLCSNVAIKERLGLSSVEDVPNLPDTHEIWDMIGHYLGTMCANLMLTLSLEKIVIGGGVMNRAILYNKIRKSFQERVADYIQHDKINGRAIDNYIVRSKFENELGLISGATVGSLGEILEHQNLRI